MRNRTDLFVVAGKNLLKICTGNTPKTASNRGFCAIQPGVTGTAEKRARGAINDHVDDAGCDKLPETAKHQSAMSLRRRNQSKHGPGSVLRPGAISEWPTISAIIPGKRST